MASSDTKPFLPPEDGEYRLHRLYSIDLDSVRYSLGLIRRYRRNDIRFCVFRELVITYARPFSGSRRPGARRYCLPPEFVPSEYRPLHDELMILRSQLFAHTDYTYHQPKVMRWNTERGPVFPMSFRRGEYEKWLKRLDEIGRLVEALDTLLRRRTSEFESAS